MFTWHGEDQPVVWERKVIRRFVIPKRNITTEVSTKTYEGSINLINAGKKYHITKANAKKIIRQGKWDWTTSFYNGTEIETVKLSMPFADIDLVEEVEYTTLSRTPLDPASLDKKDRT